MRWRPLAGRWRRATWVWIVVIVVAAVGVVALVVYSASTSVPPTRTSGAPPGTGGGAAPGTSNTGAGATGPTTTNWTVYHRTPSGAGTTDASVILRHPRRAWSSPALDGPVYGEPLVAEGLVVVATEDDTVYAMAAATGAVVWSSHLGRPVPAGRLPCGDIAPLVGITGTPVIDVTRHEVFVVDDVLAAGAPSHHLVGLDLATGAVRLDVAVDPPGADTTALLQRTGLALDQGDVVFGFGGNYGDCGRYHGWVESVPEDGGAVHRYEMDAGSGELRGAVWMGGAAPEVDSSGDIWVAVGNGSVTAAGAAYDGSDSVVELSPALALLGYFAPSAWRSDNAADHDLGSTAPALLANGTVLQVGKSKTAYLLNQADLGGIGGKLAAAHVCTAAADGGDAVLGTTVYVGCRSGLEALRTGVDPATVSVRWATTGGPTGPPVVAGGLVWSIGAGTLYGVRTSSGSTVVRLDLGTEANHFPTPAVGDGLLLAPGGHDGSQVIAFSGSAGPPAARDASPTG